MIAGLAERAQASSATLSLGPISQGRGDVAVAGRQGRRVGCGRAGVHTPPPGANPPLINSFGTLPGVQGTGIGHDVAGLCRAGIRGLPRVRASRAWIPARALWRLPCRAPGSVQRQTPGLLPELRRPTHGREWGVARGRRRVAQNILVLMLDARSLSDGIAIVGRLRGNLAFRQWRATAGYRSAPPRQWPWLSPHQ